VILGRFVTGVGVGISAVSATAYIGEMASPSHRGRMVQIYEARNTMQHDWCTRL
jgi:MFS family permease